MKNILFIFLVAFSHVKSSAQTKLNAWLPEDYVKSINAKDTTSYKYLIPIEGFESIFDNPKILMFKGELSPVRIKKIKINGNVKYNLLNLQYYVNLKYNSKEWVMRLSNSKVYLSRDKDKLLFEIIENDRKEKIYFIDRVEGYEFKTIRGAKRYLQRSRES